MENTTYPSARRPLGDSDQTVLSADPKIPRATLSWASIIAGAVVSAAILFLLSLLGTGLGLAAMSPFPESGISAKALGLTAALWLLLTQVVSAAMGGYLSGRLRRSSTGLHDHEVFFRDTAHGFIAWAVGVVISLVLIASGVGKVISGTAQVGTESVASLGSSAISSIDQNDLKQVDDYFVDTLLRPREVGQATTQREVRQEIARIVGVSIKQGNLSSDDKRYLAQVIAQNTGISISDAESRIDLVVKEARDTVERAKQATMEAAEAARKAGSYIALWSVAALLLGAFFASYAATIGGRQRDHVTV